MTKQIYFTNLHLNLKSLKKERMIEEHIDENQLYQKIRRLFEYRLFPELFSFDKKTSAADKALFCGKLEDLQAAIYYLDAHLEAHWDLDQKILDWHWENIRKHLSNFGLTHNVHHEYINHIRKYEKHERDMRFGRSPLRFDLEYFYFYKSCDVKLLRRLIYENFELRGQAGKLSDWRYYDLVTEVNDDVEDVFEDLDFINGNRFLLSLHHFGKEKSKTIFMDFLNELELKANQKYESMTDKTIAKRILDITLLRIKETKVLLLENIRKITSETLHSAKLLNY